MKERLQKILSSRGVASRRRAEELIAAGRVTCNGVISRLGDCADEDTDIICLDGTELPPRQKHIYLMLHKPRGYVTTVSDEKGRKTVMQLLTGCDARLYPVGRLDMDSEGLLLFTNDGDFANELMHPKHQIDKTYCVTVNGYSKEAFDRLCLPVTIDGYTIAKPDVMLLQLDKQDETTAQLSVTIHEGRNRQVRKMCEIAGMQVRRLVRVREGSLKLGNLPLGKWRYLTDAEVAALRSSSK